MSKTIVVNNASHERLIAVAKAEKRKIGGMAEVLIDHAFFLSKNAPANALRGNSKRKHSSCRVNTPCVEEKTK